MFMGAAVVVDCPRRPDVGQTQPVPGLGATQLALMSTGVDSEWIRAGEGVLASMRRALVPPFRHRAGVDLSRLCSV